MQCSRQAWPAKLPDHGSRFRARMLGAELNPIRALRKEARAAMLAEARKGGG